MNPMDPEHVQVLWWIIHQQAPSPKANSILNVIEWHAREMKKDLGVLAIEILHKGITEGKWPWERRM